MKVLAKIGGDSCAHGCASGLEVVLPIELKIVHLGNHAQESRHSFHVKVPHDCHTVQSH